jgi:AcrR family transcriptional regulator
MVTPEVGLRERTRRAVRGELLTIAMNLFLAQGFEETTVEQIATAAGLSRRSYFRYFASKHEVFAEALASLGQNLGEALTGRPAPEHPWPALRRAFDPLLALISDDNRVQALSRMMLEDPALQSSHVQKQAHWQATLADALEPRLVNPGQDDDEPGEDTRIRAEALAGAALSCLHTAQTRWVRPGNEIPLPTLLDLAMGAVAPLHP